MNRISRKSKAGPRRNYCSKPGVKIKESEELHSPRQKYKNISPPPTSVKFRENNVANRCCYVTPISKDFGQYYAGLSPKFSKEDHVKQLSDPDQVPSLIKDEDLYEPGISTITHLKELKKRSIDLRNKPITTLQHANQTSDNTCKFTAVSNGSCWQKVPSLIKDEDLYKPGISTITHLKRLKKRSYDLRNKPITTLQHANQTSDNTCKFTAVSNGSCWQKVDGSDDVDEILSGTAPGIERSLKHVFISEVPLVKVIAEKFSKFKRGSLEVRRLDEKVVCVEYDIFSRSKNDNVLNLTQKMRAFFSIKPLNDRKKKERLPRIPSNIKNEFKVLDEDFEKLTDKEIEFIDDTIEENKSYLEDLKRILKRTQSIKAQKNKSSLDLQSLYEMAKKDRPPLHCDFSAVNLLSKAELQEVKDLILQRCTSSVHGFRRRKIKQNETSLSTDIGVISESIMAELLTITKTLNV